MFTNLPTELKQKITAYFLMISSLFLILQFNLVPAILSGLLSYNLITRFISFIDLKIPNNKLHEKIVGLILGIISFGLLFFLIVFIYKGLQGENLKDLMQTLSDTLNQSKSFLPIEFSNYIPNSVYELQNKLSESIKTNITSFSTIGKNALHSFLLIIIGWIVGILIACKQKDKESTVLSFTWNKLWLDFADSFKFVVFAQVKVATFNSFFMFLFLFVFSPIVGWDVPYSKTLVLITFICGLIPIIGNLISNTISFIICLTVSIKTAIAALILLIVIHKLEYFIISKSLGKDIDSEIWELLIVLFVGEIFFGVGGMIFSPILYAFLKKELINIGWLK